MILLPHALVVAVAIMAVTIALAGGVATENTVVVTRGGDGGSSYARSFGGANNQSCPFDGRDIVLASPLELRPSDKYFRYNRLFRMALELAVDRINAPRDEGGGGGGNNDGRGRGRTSRRRCGGVEVAGRRHQLRLVLMGCDSDADKTSAAAEFLVRGGGGGGGVGVGDNADADVLLAPFSSVLADRVSAAAHDSGKLLIAPAAVSDYVFEGRPASFGLLPTPQNYMERIVPALASAGARTAAVVVESSELSPVGSLCGSLRDLTREHGMELQNSGESMELDPTDAEGFDSVARELSENDPDVVFACMNTVCDEWMESLRRADWSPRAMVLTSCVGNGDFERAVGTDREYVFGVAPWVPAARARDGAVNWTASEFAETFEAYSGLKPTYLAASAFATVSTAVQAMEKADSLDADDLVTVLRSADESNPIRTLYNDIFFTEHGQADLKVLGTQYDGDGNLQVVAPPEMASAGVLYPMPTWKHRDCMKLSPCGGEIHFDENRTALGRYGGICEPDGTCRCLSEHLESVGIGPTAACNKVPNEDLTLISRGLKAVGVAFVAVQGFASLFFAAWAVCFRKRMFVMASQPVFLVLVSLGCLILASAIVPSGIQDESNYGRYSFEAETREIHVAYDGSDRADVACMASIWLFGIGFTMTFSALFAKIWRVRRIMRGSHECRRVAVQAKDVAAIMVAFLVVETLVLLLWQLISPLRWERVVLSTDENGHPTKSVGMCTSESYLPFLVAFCIVKVGCLLYALYLCYITRHVPDKISALTEEGKWIGVSVIGIFQALMLGIPVLIIVHTDTNAFFFVRACITFLVSFSVTCFIFVPKFVRVHFVVEENTDRRRRFRFAGANRESRRHQVSISGNEIVFSDEPSRPAGAFSASALTIRGSNGMCLACGHRNSDELAPTVSRSARLGNDSPE